MSKINLAVLRGGPSSEYDTSLLSGQSVIDVVDEGSFNVIDIFIDKTAIWHHKGIEVKPFDILEKIDVVFNALHGSYGEDGQVQNILEHSSVPFTGPTAFGAALSFHKYLALEELQKAKIPNLKIQGHKLFNALNIIDSTDISSLADEVFASFPPPYVLKPVKGGSSFGIAIADTKDELSNLLSKMLLEYDEILVEEFISGIEITVSLVEKMREQDLYVAPVLEILKKGKRIFDYDMKYLSAIEETVRMPAHISDICKDSVTEVAKNIFTTLHGRHYARLDMVLARDKDLYLLEQNSLPGLTAHSLLPQNLELVGVPFSVFVEHIINLALEEK